MNWYEAILRTAPTCQDIEIGRVWQFIYAISSHLKATATPAKGTDVSAIYQFSSLGCVGCTGFGARVSDARIVTFRGELSMRVTIIEPQGYSANATGPELRGSRKEPNQDRNFKFGQMIFISTDGTTGIPVAGTTYFTPAPSGSTIESGLHGRICKSVVDDWDMVPGLCVSTATFIGAEAYPSATPEIVGSRTESKDDIWRYGVMRYISTDGTTGVAVPGTTYFTTKAGSTESGLTGRRCKKVDQDWDTIPNKCISTATFIGATPYVAGTDGPEIKGSRKERRAWDGKNSGEMLFLSTTTTAGVPVPNSTYFSNMDGATEGGLNGRICHDVVQDKDTIPGVVFTRANFLTAGWNEFRKPNVARVSLRGLSQQEEMILDRDGYPIQGPGRSSAYFPNHWRITKGDAAALTRKAIIVIETAYASLNPAELLGYVNTVNSNSLTNLGLPARSCRMLAPDATRWWKQGALWYANYSMLYDPACLHNEVYSLNETQVPIQMPVYDKNFAVVEDDTRTVFQWMPCLIARAAGNAKTATTEQHRPPYVERSWAALDGMIVFD